MNKHFLKLGYIVLIFFATFIYGISSQLIGTLISRIILHYDIRMAQAGLLSSFINVGNFAAIIIITIFAGRINKMILMGVSLLLYSASLFLISTAPSFGIILASFALIGVFGATTDTLINSLVADLMPDKISLSLSLLHGAFGLGGLCGPIIIERLALSLSWEQVYFVSSAVFFIYVLIYVLFVRLQWSLLANNVSYKKQVQFGLSDIAQFFTRKRNVLLWLIMFLYAGNQTTLAVWIKRYVEIHIDEPAWGAYALSIMWLGIALSRLIVSPGIKASSPMKIGVGNFVSAIALAAGLISGSAQGIIAASFVVGLGSGLTIPLILALGCEWHQEKTAFGTMMPFTAFFISSVVFPPLSGHISDLLGIPWGVAVGVLSAILTAVFAWVLDVSLKPGRSTNGAGA